MAIKYLLEYKDITNTDWSVSIDIPDYTGEIIPILGVGKDVLSIDWLSQTSDDPHAQHVIPSTAKLQVYSDALDLTELMLTPDLTYRVVINRDGNVFWKGWLTSDGIQKSRQSVNYPVTLTATDGLDKLSGREFSKSFNPVSIITTSGLGSRYAPIHHVRAILQESWGINNGMTINWMCNLKSFQYQFSDALSGLNKLDALRYLRDYANKDCDWYLTNIMKSLRCWIRQYNGEWWIVNYDDIIANDGIFNGWSIPVTGLNENITATAITQDLNVTIDTTIANDGYDMLKKPVSKVVTRYTPVVRDNGNVIPDFDFNKIDQWYAVEGIVNFSRNDFDLSERDGKSLSAEVPTSFSDGDKWITFGQTFIDTSVLFKKATMGFLWCPVSGYDLTTDGYIDWSKKPISIRVSLSIDTGSGVEFYYLNPFGYWSNKNTTAKGEIISQAYVPPPPSPLYRITFDGTKGFEPGDRFNYRSVSSLGNIITRTYVFTTTESTSTGLDLLSSAIGAFKSGNSIEITFGVLATSTINAWMDKDDDYYKTIDFEGDPRLKLNDILSIQFESSGNANEIKLPKLGEATVTSGIGALTIEFKVKDQCKMYLDSVYFRVGEVSDVYEVTNNGTNEKKEYEMEISSSFNGHFNSSYMDSYNNSNQSMLWAGNRTLTSNYAIESLRWFNTPNRIFQGTAVGMIGMNSFITLDDGKFISLGNSINCHTNQTKVLLFEAKKSTIEIDVTHKSSEDN